MSGSELFTLWTDMAASWRDVVALAFSIGVGLRVVSFVVGLVKAARR